MKIPPFKHIFGPVATILFLGAHLTLLLTILTGSTEKSVMKHFYWLETDCSGFTGRNFAGDCRWTNYGLCAVDNGGNTNCTSNTAAYPFDPHRNFGSSDGLPSQFQNNNNYYYYVSRIGYGFQLAGVGLLFLSFIAFFLFWFMSKVATATALWILFSWATAYIITGVVLSTVAYVKGRNIFRDFGLTTHLGVRPFALGWTTIAQILLLWVFLCLMHIPRNLGREYADGDYSSRGNSGGGWYQKLVPAHNVATEQPHEDYVSPHNNATIGSTVDTKVTDESAQQRDYNPAVYDNPAPQTTALNSSPPARQTIV